MLNYDQASANGVALGHPVGRLSSESAGYSGQVFGYDALGRVTENDQCTPLRPCAGGSFPLAYGYNRLGQVTGAGDGVGDTFTRQYNRAGRLTGLNEQAAGASAAQTLLSGLHD